MSRSLRMVVCGLLLAGACASAVAASDTDAVKMVKVDPPNWWAGMPKAMLLVKGEHLDGASFKLSDKKLRVERTVVSANGHWAQVWLSGSPERAETVDLVAERGGRTARMEYRFEERKASADGLAAGGGFAGF